VAGIIAVIAFVWIASELVGSDDDPGAPVTVPEGTDAPVVTEPVGSDPITTDG